MQTFEKLESNVRGYVRSFPTVFKTARGAELWNESGERYLDFFAGAGTLNYGHNNAALKQPLIDYLAADGIVHALDMATEAKRTFLQTFERLILEPRKLDYKIQFCGPTGTNAVEAAMKLARKLKGRSEILSFSNAFHGMTLGSLSITGNRFKRNGAGVCMPSTTSMPFDGYMGKGLDTLDLLEKQLGNSSSGVDLPAAIIVETVQGEGGINVARASWLRRLASICEANDILFIIDDIQVGCGRTGRFFSFEEAGVVPDMVTLSKSLSGYGNPMAIVLMKPELDVWSPGEHNGTFRGFNPGFVTATAALETFWADGRLTSEVESKGRIVHDRLVAMAERFGGTEALVRGRGLIQGVVCGAEHASAVSHAAFERGLIIETSGADDEVVKVLPPLTIPTEHLIEGLKILETAVSEVMPAARRATKESVLHS